MQILDRLLGVGAELVVVGELSVVSFEGLCEESLDRLCRALMESLAPLHQNRVVSDFLRERVLEHVLRLGIERLLIDEFRGRELIERAAQLRLGKRSEEHTSELQS